jgi:hypothetical protein
MRSMVNNYRATTTSEINIFIVFSSVPLVEKQVHDKAKRMKMAGFSHQWGYPVIQARCRTVAVDGLDANMPRNSLNWDKCRAWSVFTQAKQT